MLGIGLELALNRDLISRKNIIKKRSTSLAFEKTPSISLSCMLVPVHYREYKYGLL